MVLGVPRAEGLECVSDQLTGDFEPKARQDQIKT